MKDLNMEELILGAAFALMWASQMGLGQTIFFGTVASIFWAKSGRGDSKLWRRLGVPVVIVSGILMSSQHTLQSALPLLAWIPICFGILSLGYGIPSTQPPDSGSWLGRITFRIARGNETLATILAHGVIFADAYLSYALLVYIWKAVQ